MLWKPAAKRFSIGLLSVLFVLGSAVPAYGKTTEELRQEQEKYQTQIDEAQQKIAELEQEAAPLKEQINAYTEKINLVEEEVDTLEKQVNVKKQEISSLEHRFPPLKPILTRWKRKSPKSRCGWMKSRRNATSYTRNTASGCAACISPAV